MEITTETEITIRMLDEGDGEALARLAQRDSGEVPLGRLLGAAVDGRLVVARSLATGAVIADPFVPTAEVQALLARRAAQLRAADEPHRRLRRLFGRRSRAALPASPPGAGGRLLTLPPRAL
ncbi:MAG TPA: hypothetical protein VHH72_08190 [Solirubrobacterales bacterium]|nr:hypothetical protein [Solirubrobacterales bacterium]